MLKHFYESVPGWATFRPLYTQAVAHFPTGSRFVEIGSWLGKSAAFMAVEIINSGKEIEFWAVDPWLDGGPDLKHKVAEMKEPIWDQFCRNISPVSDRVLPVRAPSLEAVELFEDGSIDFLMIDGDHSYPAVRADIAAWLPKMRKGGWLAGDDYNWSGVKRAFDEAFGDRLIVIDTGKKQKKAHTKNAQYCYVRL